MKKVIPGKIKTQLRLDGYYNVLNKYGTQHDSTEYYQWASGSAVSDTELADLYAGNGLFSTVIDAPADDATKNGIDLGIKDKDLQKQIDNHLQTIRYQSKFAKALRWARLFGGAAVVMLVDDGRLLQDPLNWRDVHGVEELLVYGRNEMYPLWVNNHTAKLTPNLKVTTDDGREVPYPEISGAIILMPCGAGGTVGFAFPVKSDDGCLALFNEGGSGTDLKWDLSNAALLPGLYQSPGEQVKKAGSEEAAIMFAPSSTITVTKDKIEIKKDDTKITVTSDSIKMEKGSTTVTASSSSVDVTSPNLNIKGNTKVNGNISVTGNVTISGTLTLGGIVMNTHTHVGVHGPTGGPV